MLSNTRTLSAPSLKISFYRVTLSYLFSCVFIHFIVLSYIVYFISPSSSSFHFYIYIYMGPGIAASLHQCHTFVIIPIPVSCDATIDVFSLYLFFPFLPFPVRCLSFLSESLDFSISLNFILFYCTLLYSTLLYITFPFLSLNLINSHHII